MSSLLFMSTGTMGIQYCEFYPQSVVLHSQQNAMLIDISVNINTLIIGTSYFKLYNILPIQREIPLFSIGTSKHTHQYAGALTHYANRQTVKNP
jgi:hypothetical protein